MNELIIVQKHSTFPFWELWKETILCTRVSSQKMAMIVLFHRYIQLSGFDKHYHIQNDVVDISDRIYYRVLSLGSNFTSRKELLCVEQSYLGKMYDPVSLRKLA